MSNRLHIDVPGVPLSYYPDVCDQVHELANLVRHGRGVRNSESEYAQKLIDDADKLGEVAAPDGMVFALCVGDSSRVSSQERDTDGKTIWVPHAIARSGLAFAAGVRAIDLPVVDLDNQESALWEFGTVVGRVVSPDPSCRESIKPTRYRVHLGPFAVVHKVKLVPIGALSAHSARTHPISLAH